LRLALTHSSSLTHSHTPAFTAAFQAHQTMRSLAPLWSFQNCGGGSADRRAAKSQTALFKDQKHVCGPCAPWHHCGRSRIAAVGGADRRASKEPALVDLYKIFVWQFRGCALVNSILGMIHLLYFAPFYFAHTPYRATYVWSTTDPLLCARHHTILVVAISCKGQVGLYTILPLPILYVEWVHRGGGGKPYIAHY